MNKQILFFTLLLLAVCFPALAEVSIEPGNGDLPREEAVRIATEQFLTACASDKEMLNEFTVVADFWEAYTRLNGVVPCRWEVMFSYMEDPNVHYCVLVASSTGEVIETVPEDFSSQMKRIEKNAEEKKAVIEHGKTWMAEKGPWRLWSYQDKATFITAYGRDPDGNPRKGIGVPDDKDIPLEKAVSIAWAVIVREFGDSVERLSLLYLDCTFFSQYLLGDGTISRAWFIVFRGPPVNGDYQPRYQASILSPGGEVYVIHQILGLGKRKSWPLKPEPTSPYKTVECTFLQPEGRKVLPLRCEVSYRRGCVSAFDAY